MIAISKIVGNGMENIVAVVHTINNQTDFVGQFGSFPIGKIMIMCMFDVQASSKNYIRKFTLLSSFVYIVCFLHNLIDQCHDHSQYWYNLLSYDNIVTTILSYDKNSWWYCNIKIAYDVMIIALVLPLVSEWMYDIILIYQGWKLLKLRSLFSNLGTYMSGAI